MTYTQSLSEESSLSPVKQPMAIRLCFSAAALAIGGSLFTVLPLWNSTAADKLPLFRVAVLLLSAFLIAGSCTCAFLSQYLPGQWIAEQNRAWEDHMDEE